MSKSLITGWLLILSIPLFAQNVLDMPGNSVGIKIGEKMPDFVIPHISNYPDDHVRLSAFRGKLIILDFWFTGCAGCIEKFPELKKLQDLFGGKIQIVLVNYQTQKDISARFARMHHRESIYTMVNLPSVTSDTIFEHMFPHTIAPHEVWIDATGTVRAITDAHDVNEDNIRSMLADAAFTLPEKHDFLTHDPFKPLLPQIFQMDPEDITFSETILKYYPGLRGPVVTKAIDSFAHTVRITRANCSILELIGEAILAHSPQINSDPAKSSEFDFGKRMILYGIDSSRLFYDAKLFPDHNDWDQKNRYSFEAIVPQTMEAEAYGVMLETISRYFRLHAGIEQRTLPCLALVRTSGMDKIKTEGLLTDSLYDPHKIQCYGCTMEDLRAFISLKNRNTPLIFSDDTGYTGSISIDLSCDLTDIPALKKELRLKYDLDLIEKTEPVNVLVIRQE
jgi:thiol-disulfide isomerase/thioredoxin